MNTVELMVYSLQNAFEILDGVTADLTQEQADWMPPGTAVPIGALYWHLASATDEILHGWAIAQPPLFETAGWSSRVVLDSDPAEDGEHAGRLRLVRVDLKAAREYASAVRQAAEVWLGSLAPEDLDRELDTPMGALALGQMLESFVIWHISAHCGEISALKGCQGAKGYPF